MNRLLLVLVALTGLSASPASAQRCDIPRVLLTIDRSSSMLGAATDGLTKWDAASVAISDVTMAYEGRIDFGLSVFPYPDRCQPGEVVLDFGAHDSMDVALALGAPPPSGGNWTPMSQTLDAAGAYLGEAASGVHLVLVTDGWQWCSPYSASTRFDPVTSVMRLRAMGMTVHIVGFGTGVDALTLNRAAVAGGASIAGCDPTLRDPSAAGHCYAQVGDLSGLRGALESIARSVTTELCNGLDDDCDAVIDPDCSCTDGQTLVCGVAIGACRQGTSTCALGAYGSCEASVSASPESCDGSDQDCDGTIDENVHCADGYVCMGGACTEVMPPTPPTPVMPMADGGVAHDGGQTHDGSSEGDVPPPQRGACACSAQGNDPAPVGLIAIGLLVVLFRRPR